MAQEQKSAFNPQILFKMFSIIKNIEYICPQISA